MSDARTTNSVLARLRAEQENQAARLGEEDADDRVALARDAADEIERLRELARGVIENLRCEHVHHPRADWHKFTAPCPVLARLRAAIETGDGK